MKKNSINIIPFEVTHQAGIDILFRSIAEEFTEQVFPDPSQTITTLSRSPNRIYWVALANEEVIGTVGILFLTNNGCALKSLFVAKEFRGHETGIASRLLQTAMYGASAHECKIMYLGTMQQFAAAQRFYEKHGFALLRPEELPADFPANSVDTVFYKKILNN